MRVIAVHEDVLVITSSLWQTNAVAIRSGAEAMLIDSPYFADELELLPEMLRQSGFEPAGLLASHADWDLVVTAQQVRSYKPDPAHFKECARRIGGKKGWVHIASGYEADIGPCIKDRIPVIWVNRHGEKLESNQKKPTEEVKNLREAAKLLGVA